MRLSTLILAGTAALLTSTCVTGTAAPAAKPNVLFFFADDQQAATIAALGNPHIKTPVLDRLARAGVSFRRACMTGGMTDPMKAKLSRLENGNVTPPELSGIHARVATMTKALAAERRRVGDPQELTVANPKSAAWSPPATRVGKGKTPSWSNAARSTPP